MFDPPEPETPANRIRQTLLDIQALLQVESGTSLPTCSSWLTNPSSPGTNTWSVVIPLLVNGHTYGRGVFLINGKPDDRKIAMVGGTNPDGTDNMPAGYMLAVNNNGLFYQSSSQFAVGEYPNVYPPMGYPGNTPRANADTLIHEVAHITIPEKDMPPASRDISMWRDSGPKDEALGQAHNSFLIALKCGTLILSGFPP